MPQLPVFRVVAYRLEVLVWWTGNDFEHRHQSNSNLFYLFKHVGQYSGAAVLKSGPQIATKTGNPAGLLLRRIWYSLGKSGVLGITEYRQDRPLFSIQHNMIAQTSELKRLQIGRKVQTSSASTQTSSASTRISSVKFCFNSDTFGFNSDKFGFNSDKFGQVLL